MVVGNCVPSKARGAVAAVTGLEPPTENVAAFDCVLHSADGPSDTSPVLLAVVVWISTDW